MQFVGREQELQNLESQYARQDASFVVIYGRRRVGKTTLISQFIADKPSLYFLATEESQEQNRQAFCASLADFLDDELLRIASVNDWLLLFKRFADTAVSATERLILVIDEFQYLGKADSAFPSVFQKAWDQYLQKSNVMVILCGSLISMMTSQTLDYSSPLYGRRTAQIRLQPIEFEHYSKFFATEPTRLELVKKYSITGGVPKYIEEFTSRESALTLVRSRVLDRSSFLFEEPTFLLSKEVGDVGSYFSIIKAIANGASKLNEISSRLGVPSTSLTRYLSTLNQLDIVEREVPITEPNPTKSKRGLYKIKDNYLRFWFRFIFPNMGLAELGQIDAIMPKIEANFIDGHVSYAYEDICKQKLWRVGAKGQLPFLPEKVGRYWDKDIEIDAVALSETENSIMFCECKFWKGKVGLNILEALEQKAARVRWGGDNRKTSFAIFSISGFTKELQEIAESRDDVFLFD